MRFFPLFFLFGLLVAALPETGWAQNPELDGLVKALEKAEGWDAAQFRLELAERLIRENKFREAERYLKEVEEIADEHEWVQLEALVLHQEGKIALAKSRLKRAQKLFESSNAVIQGTENEVLYLENILSQIEVAQKSNDPKEELRLQQILSLNLRNKSNPPPERPVAEEKRRVGGLQTEPLPAKRDYLQNLPRIEFSDLINEAGDLSDSLLTLNRRNRELNRRVEAQKAQLSQLSEEQMRQKMELAMQQMLLDSMSIKSLQDSVALTRQQVELEQKAGQRNMLLIGGGASLLLLLGLFWRFRSVRRYNNLLESEKKRSDDLLLNILPGSVAEELKQAGVAKARKYEQVTVLFSDFKDFSKKAKELEPQQLVEELDYCFKAFDNIVQKYGLEKIKTIGDAYMCAGGLPDPDPDHPRQVLLAAAEMQAFLHEWKLARQAEQGLFFEARIGIHTGPLVAGVVGIKKFAYDIWGDTVNVAARMETHSEPGRINISEKTYQLVKDHFTCVPRGRVPIKNLGEIEMYFVETRPGASVSSAEERVRPAAG